MPASLEELTRPIVLVLACSVLAVGCGPAAHCKCAARIDTNLLAPGQVEQVPVWLEEIKTTIAVEDWNAEGSPHRIVRNPDGTIDIWTNPGNVRKITEYLRREIGEEATD